MEECRVTDLVSLLHASPHHKHKRNLETIIKCAKSKRSQWRMRKRWRTGETKKTGEFGRAIVQSLYINAIVFGKYCLQ